MQQISVRSFGLMCSLFKACVSLLIFFLGDLSIAVSGMFPAIIVLLLISHFIAVSIM